jgi:ethanolamine utilization protein EutA
MNRTKATRFAGVRVHPSYELVINTQPQSYALSIRTAVFVDTIHEMTSQLKLVGLDFGTTTSSAIVATAQVVRSAVSGRTELAGIHECFRSEPVFTPYRDEDALDERQIERLLDEWLDAGNVSPAVVFGGGAILTGLAARAQNAAALVRLIRARLHDALIATADDPCFESWLAFMGSAAALSRARPDTAVLNLDIGGGTTNLALGRAGQVLATGCLFVGARHAQFEPGTHRLVKVSSFAQAVFQALEIPKGPGDLLDPREVDAIVNCYVDMLEHAVSGRGADRDDPLGVLHEQVPLRYAREQGEPVITFSGGVGELIYRFAADGAWPETTAYGDLGIDLARGTVASPLLSKHLHDWRPASAGRATVYGLLRHSTEVSGTSLFVSHPSLLPLADLPIFGLATPASSDDEIRGMLELVRRSTRGGCVQVKLASPKAADVRTCGQRFAALLRSLSFPADHPLVLLVNENVGKLLGSYVTEWGALPLSLAVIDEVSHRDARFAQIGAPHHQVVPVSFDGFSGERGT